VVKIVNPFEIRSVAFDSDASHGEAPLGLSNDVSALDRIGSMIPPAFTGLVKLMYPEGKPEILRLLESSQRKPIGPDEFQQFDGEGAAKFVKDKPEIVMYMAGLVSGALVAEATHNALVIESKEHLGIGFPKFSSLDLGLVGISRRDSFQADALLRSYFERFLNAPFREFESFPFPERLEVIRYSGFLAADTALNWMTRRPRRRLAQRKTDQLMAEVKLCSALNSAGMPAEYGSFSQYDSGIKVIALDQDRPVVFDVVASRNQQCDLQLQQDGDDVYVAHVAIGDFLLEQNFRKDTMQELRVHFPNLEVPEEVVVDARVARSRDRGNRPPQTHRRPIIPRFAV